ncbi:LysR family transcriptional regulator [Aliidongia dinghuensis]|uniref:LysR family transcriptional regulator n=1 Tax=Aliidongia dinghuensis TaxID=1867774 RepID=A0A8J3E687_9PROT|nr:LysR family transcriptional regulator [Aliidongia dinghuensis]GGF42183.1 LysR family transcriptional regulator [Aliidongia dinghuensis]
MSEPGFPSLDQLRVFLTVVETGSFTAAAKKLGRAISAVSYTIANLEQQLGIALFDRDQARTPKLTEAGSAIVSKASVVAVGIDDLRASVRALLKGLEAEVTLVVDVMLPSERLVDAVQAFEATFPTVKLRLHVEALSAVAQSVRRDGAMIGIGGGLLDIEPGLELIHVGDVEMIPVAAPNHPLAQSRPVAPGAARRHRQLILTVRMPFAEGPDVGVFAAETWRVADLGAKHALLLAGIGWGNMPEPNIRADLAAGRLVRLELPEAKSGLYPFQAMYRTDQPPGPAAAWLIQRFVDQAW